MLSEQDREALGPFAWGLMVLSDRPDAISAGRELSEAVEAIVASHVAAALEAAAMRCDRKATEWAEEYAETDSDADYGRWDAWENAARIVRTHNSPARQRH